MVKRSMFSHFAPCIALSIWGAAVLLPSVAHAEVPLNRAVIASLRNKVELLLKNQARRSAKVRDTLVPGDALSTARAALAELRFNDGSLARIGGQALFRFLPKTRTFNLSNGTLLLLVPPGRGQTRIQTPNAAAGIRGSALFVRYLPDTDVTLIGALTDSGIEITNRDRTQTQPLEAGQIAVVVKDRIEQVYRFDLKTFYDSSDLVKGLDLQRSAPSNGTGTPVDQAIAAVRTETSEAVKTQASLGIFNGATAADGQPLTPNVNASQGNQTTSIRPLDQLTAPASPSALPNNYLFVSPTLALPTAFPPTVAIPTPPNSAAGAAPIPGSVGTGTVPTGNIPGQGGLPPEQVGNTPGQGGDPPGQVGNTPGQGGSPPPGQVGNTPGQAGDTPGRGLPPGQAGTTPGQSGNTPGQGGGLPPGQAGTTPGQSGNTPGQAR
ncbi:FecR family protein [Leptolyngbya sp. FACHB-321]|uniref:FecR family protein n=1 Tax=Leptolyngbya sp. FACHB-321 TaxID=2692807 RepID=UPI0018EFE3D7|nr:FecR family protein [Leptolyngbya sp. FACHB-321]